ncbi:MAG: SPOR domain-containing protein [Betaproteobacteria bacterium]|nr:SPOR domain-containing protein [Betaproteobacteria bacterium]
MAEQDTSPNELQLKKRARRRLVGAVALALLAVIVLPMVMDREPRPLSQDIQVRIPSQDAPGIAAKLLPGKPVATPMPPPEPKPVAEQKAEVQAKSESAPAASAAAPVPAKPAAHPSAAAAVKPAEKPAEKLTAPEKKAESVEQPATKTAADAKPATDASGQWVIQLGAYKETGNVKLLLAKLKGVGVPAYTEKIESPQGSRTRVRAGPFASQEAAEKARARVKIIGVDGPVAPK